MRERVLPPPLIFDGNVQALAESARLVAESRDGMQPEITPVDLDAN